MIKFMAIGCKTLGICVCRYRYRYRMRSPVLLYVTVTCYGDTRAVVIFLPVHFLCTHSRLTVKSSHCATTSCNSCSLLHLPATLHADYCQWMVMGGGQIDVIGQRLLYLGSYLDICKCNYTVRQTAGHEQSRDGTGTRGGNHIEANKSRDVERGRTNVAVKRTVDKNKRQGGDALNQRQLRETITHGT